MEIGENSTIPDLLAALRTLAPAGYAIGLHLRYTTPSLMFQTYPEAWLAEYSREGLLLQDPVVAWSFAHRGVTTWAALAGQDPGGVLARAAAHGMTHGLALSLEEGGSLSMAGFARGDRPFRPDESAAVETALQRLHALTDGAAVLPEALRERLRRLSIAVTQA